MFAPNIDNDEIVKLPRLSFAGEAFVISTEDELREKIKLFSASSILGFDTESKPSFKKGRNNGIALVQLSDEKTEIGRAHV